jgi:hypothetical protein
LVRAFWVCELMTSRSMHSRPISSTRSVLRTSRYTPQSPTSHPPTPLTAKLNPFCRPPEYRHGV